MSSEGRFKQATDIPREPVCGGARGALALISGAGELIDVADMPVLADGPKAGRQ